MSLSKIINRLLNVSSLYAEISLAGLQTILSRRKRSLALGAEVSTELGPVRRVLVFGYMGIGDAVMFEPTLSAIATHFPDAQFDVILGKTPLVLDIFRRVFERQGREISNVIEFDFKSAGLYDRRALNAQLGSIGYDLVIATYTAPLQYFVATIQSARVRAGHLIRWQRWYKPRPNFLFNVRAKLDQDVNEREPERYIALAHALGVKQTFEPPVPDMRLGRFAWEPSKIVAVQLGVSPSMQWKRWSEHKYLEVFQTLRAEGYRFRFFATEAESQMLDPFRLQLDSDAEVLIDKGLDELCSAISQCEFFIGNDSGLGHLAVALGVPSVRVFGPSDRFGCEPYHSQHRIVYKELTCSPCWTLGMVRGGYNFNNCGHHNCLHYISADDVLASIEQLELRTPS